MTDYDALTAAWQQLRPFAPALFDPITDEESLHATTQALMDLDMEMGENPDHPLRDLADAVMHRILAYEQEHHPIPDIRGGELLKSLMVEHGHTQLDVARATGISNAVISRLLSGEREMTPDHMRHLGQLYRVPPGLFL